MQFHATLVFDFFHLNGGYRERERKKKKKGNKFRKKEEGGGAYFPSKFCSCQVAAEMENYQVSLWLFRVKLEGRGYQPL